MNSTQMLEVLYFISVSIKQLVKEIESVFMTPGRRKQLDQPEYQLEMCTVRSITGNLGYIGLYFSPIASFAASYTQQCFPGFTVSELKIVSGVMRDTIRRSHMIQYLPPSFAEFREDTLWCSKTPVFYMKVQGTSHKKVCSWC